MSGRLFDPTTSQSFQPRSIVPQMDVRAAGAVAASAAAGSEVAARSLATVSDEFVRIEAQRRAVAEGEAESRARSSYLMGMARLREELRGLPPEQIEERWNAGRQRLATEAGQGLSDRTAARFRAAVAQVDANEFGNMVEVRARRTNDLAVASLLEEIDGLRRQATASPGDRETALSAIDAAIQNRIESGAMTAQAGTQLRLRTRASFDETAVLDLMNRDPGAALRALQGGQFPNLDPAARERMENSAEGRLAARAARAEADRARRDRVVGIELGQIDNMMLSGFVPEDRLARLRQMAQGTSYEGAVATMERDAREIGRWQALPADRQAERLTEIQGRLEGGRGTPEDFAQFSRLARATQAQQQDVARSGLDRAVRDRLVDNLPPLDFGNPASLNARVGAAQIASAHYGRPVSPFTTDDLRGMVQRFTAGSTEDALAVVNGVAGIADPAVRAEAVRALERARGDAGRMPAGTLARVTEMMRSPDLEDQLAARRLLDALRTPTDGRVRQMSESQELRQAMLSAQDSAIQSVRVRQAEIGGAPFAALLSRDMQIIQDAAAVYMAGGESPSRAVQRAQADLNRGLAMLDDSRLAHVYFPGRQIDAATMTQGLRLLREQAVPAVDPALGQDQALAARQRAEAARRAVWINEGNAFALVSTGTSAPVILRRATLDDVRQAVDGADARQRAVTTTRRTGRMLPAEPLPPAEPDASAPRPAAPVMR